MRKPLVSVLLLATVALSSSNLLRAHTFDTELGLHRHDDNIFRNKFDTRNIFYSLFCKQRNGASQQDDLVERCKYLQMSNRAENDNNNLSVDEYNDGESKDHDDNYDGEGFRKEQWHNYPRRLDRLQTYPYDRHKAAYFKRTPEVINYDDSADIPSDKEANLNDITINEDILASNNIKNVHDYLVTTTNPLLILKILLPSLYKQKTNENFTNSLFIRLENERNIDDNEKLLAEDLNPDIHLLGDKQNDQIAFREGDDLEEGTGDSQAHAVEKRLFSLWSRLQSLSHEKGHELHHRRHLHALYDHPGLDLGGDILTAKTRAALMRPPGSPLRWG